MIKYVFLLGLTDWAKNLKQSYFFLAILFYIMLKDEYQFYISYLPLYIL